MKPSNPQTTQNILSLSAQEALDFFMQSEQYHGFELPEYFDFDEVLNRDTRHCIELSEAPNSVPPFLLIK